MANLLTVSRIVLSVMLPFFVPLQPMFFVLYAVCGITDMLDGYIARKTHTQSLLGARLDSIADLVMAAAAIYALYPVVQLPTGAAILIAGIAAVRFVSIGIAWKKFGAFAIVHTYANKVTGLLIFLFPFTLTLLEPALPLWIICGAALASAVEELMIQISSKSLDADRKSIFFRG